MKETKTICWIMASIIFMLLLAVNINRNETTQTEIIFASLTIASLFMAWNNRSK